MAKNNNMHDFLTDIANTIREENGTTALINPQDFGSKITGIGDKLRNIIQGTVTEITPEMLTGITTLRPSAFSGYGNLTKITLPEGVTYIGAFAFDGCSSLTKLNLPNSLEQFDSGILSGPIGGTDSLEFNSDDNGFMYLGNDTNPYMVLWYGEVYDENFAFQSGTKIISGGYGFYVGIPTLNIPDQIISIEDNSLNGDVEVLNCGSGLKNIGSYAFNGISNLREVNVSESNPFYSSASGIVYDKNKTIFVYVPKKIVTADIPDTVIKIPNSQFQSLTSLTSVTIPNSVQTIGGSAFYGCSNLTSVTLPSSVTSIGTNVFYNCTKLSYASVPNVGGYMFYGCKAMVSVDIANGATYIGNNAFQKCTGLTSITIPDSVTRIGAYALDGCTGLASVTIGNSVTSIGDYAFRDCTGLTSVTIGNSVTSIGDYAFDGCTGLTSITVNTGNSKYHSNGNCLIETGSKTLILGCQTSVIPSDGSVTSIGYYAFSGCTGLTSVTIPNSVTSIGSSAFSGCTGLTSVTIGNGVTSIGGNAFQNCKALNAVYIEDVAVWCSISFPGNYANPLTFAKHLYLNSKKVTDLEIPEGVNAIGKYAFSNCIDFTSITISGSVDTIGGGAFQNCTELTSVTYKGNVILSNFIFDGCSKIVKYDFRNATSIPTLGATFYLGYATGCKIIVPDALYSSWKSATNWSALKNVNWVKASEYTEE